MNYTGSMPELKSRYGYLWAIGLTVVSTLATFWWLRRKKWL
jgi:Mg2+ and Co2+ transporter CorA